MSVRVVVGDGESLPSALRRFKKRLFHAGVMYEWSCHKEYTSPGEYRRVAKGRAKRKAKVIGLLQKSNPDLRFTLHTGPNEFF